MSPEPAAKPAVEMSGITRRYGSVVANDGASLKIEPASVHALCGENGAGKSTLMKILGGLDRPDSGDIRLWGEPVAFRSPADSIACGVGMVHQHFMLVEPFTVAENVTLGAEPHGGPFGLAFDRAAAEAAVAELSARHGLDVEPRARIADLGVGQRQRVEILKVLARRARVIILDEPTAVLTPSETDQLLETIRSLRASGCAVVLITHKLREAMAVADAVTVMRAGRTVASVPAADTDCAAIARLMVGRDVATVNSGAAARAARRAEDDMPLATPAAGMPSLPAAADPMFESSVDLSLSLPGPGGVRLDAPVRLAMSAPPRQSARDSGIRRIVRPVLGLRGVRVDGPRGARPALDGIDLHIPPGEIVGIAGVEGNGQSELLNVISGMRAVSAGTVSIAGWDMTHSTPRARFAAGLGVIAEDRHRQAMILDFTVAENLKLGRHHRDVDATITEVDAAGVAAQAGRLSRAGDVAALLVRHDVRPPDASARGAALSGGNQQKMVVAREMTRTGLKILVAAQPTRGVDLGAVEAIHKRLLALRDSGVGILLFSAELTEILALSDRVAVMYGGRIVFTAENHRLTEADLGAHMAGAGVAAVQP